MELKPGYKQTEVGVIPEDWGTARLLEVACSLDGLRVPLNEAQRRQMKGDIPYCGANGVLDYVNDYVIDDDIILMAEDGGHFDEYATRPIAYRMSGKCWVNNHAHILKAKFGHDQGFLFFSLVHKNILSFLASGTRAKLNKSEMLRIMLALPPLPEQGAIAEALSDAGAWIESLEHLIAKKRDIKQGAMQELLTGKHRFPGFKGEWKETCLGETCTVVMGQSPPSRSYNAAGKGLPLIQGNVDIRERKAIRRIFTSEITKLGVAGDTLISVRAPVGEIATIDFDVCLGRGMAALRGGGAFLYHLMVFKEPTWASLSKGSTFDSVSSKELREFSVRVPPTIAEAEAIVSVFTDMDAEIAALESKLEKARMIKQGMMQELLTGRIRLV